jgi:hypothetical protein
MALPGKPGRPSAEEAPLVEAKHAIVMKLRAQYDTSFVELAKITGYTPRTCEDIFYRNAGRRRLNADLDERRVQLLADLLEVQEELRPWVVGDATPTTPPPRTRDPVAKYLKVLHEQGVILGVYGPTGNQPQPTVTYEDPQAGELEAERIATFTALVAETRFAHQPIFEVD